MQARVKVEKKKKGGKEENRAVGCNRKEKTQNTQNKRIQDKKQQAF